MPFNFENLSAHFVANILNFPKTPSTFGFLDEIEGSYGRFSTKQHFFRHPVCILHIDVRIGEH